MNHILVPNPNRQSPVNSLDPVLMSKVKAGDSVDVSVVFTWDKPLAESMRDYYLSIGASARCGGPAYDDPGGEFCPGKYTIPGVVITHRGCPRNCPWCYVPKREGRTIRHLEVKEGNILQDNNILACNRDHKNKVWAMLKKQRAVSLRGGLDARLLKDEDVEAIRSLRLANLFLAYDHRDNRVSVISAIRSLRMAGIPQSKIQCYVLLGFDGETEDAAEDRLLDVYLAGGLPFAQLYDKYSGEDKEGWKRLARRWSRPAIFKAIGDNRYGVK